MLRENCKITCADIQKHTTNDPMGKTNNRVDQSQTLEYWVGAWKIIHGEQFVFGALAYKLI
jgi:hypothetical protein